MTLTFGPSPAARLVVFTVPGRPSTTAMRPIAAGADLPATRVRGRRGPVARRPRRRGPRVNGPGGPARARPRPGRRPARRPQSCAAAQGAGLRPPSPRPSATCRPLRPDPRRAHGNRVTYSPKVFIPLTHLCRDRCGYCTFASPGPPRRALPLPDEVLAVARAGAAAGCHEALFTLGEAPEDRYPVAPAWLAEHGYASTVDYLVAMCALVRDETGLLPHANAGALGPTSWPACGRSRPARG